MTLAQQLHRSATHKPGLDPDCPVCAPVVPSFSEAYAARLGYQDAREFGTKHPHRDFSRHESDNKPNDRARAAAYYVGLERGLAVTRQYGLDMHCGVRWDNPGFDTPECGKKATHLAFPTFGLDNDRPTQVLSVCDRHARQAETVREKDGHYNFAVEPMNWQL